MYAMARDSSAKPGRVTKADVEAACRGDREARRRVARRLYDRVRTTVFYLTGGGPDAEDLVQQSLLEILRSLPGWRGEAALETWADRITVRTAMRSMKKRRRLREVLLSQAEEDDETRGLASASPDRLADADVRDPVQETARRMLRRRLAALLQHMPEERRTAVVLRWVHGYSIEEVARITGVRVNTARGRLRKGKKELRQLVLSDPVLRDWVDLVTP